MTDKHIDLNGLPALILNSDGLPLNMFPLSTVAWEETIRLYVLDRITVLEKYENIYVNSPSRRLELPSVIMLKKFVTTERTVKFSRRNIYLRDNYICQYCSNDFSKKRYLLTCDHVVPKSSGGLSTWTNLSTACQECNTKKADKFDMKPIKKPKKPTYYQLLENRKKYPLFVNHPSWIPYLNWPEDNITVDKITYREDEDEDVRFT